MSILLTVKEAAEAANRPQETIRVWCREKQLRAIEKGTGYGRRWFILPSDLEAFLATLPKEDEHEV